GIAGGEVAAADRAVVLDMLVTMVAGLLLIGVGVPTAQARAVKGFKRLLTGTLMVRCKSAARPDRAGGGGRGDGRAPNGGAAVDGSAGTVPGRRVGAGGCR